MKTLKNAIFIQICVIYTRYLIGGAYVFASIVKIQGLRFTSQSGEAEAINTSWHFFETMYQSGIYWNFLGWGQLIASFLLMTQRFSKLGAVTFFPISLNIFVITVSYNFTGTIYITSLMLLANIALLVWDWGELKTLLNIYPADITDKNSFEKMKIWELCGLVLFAFTVFWRIFMPTNPIFWFVGCLLIGLIFLVVGLRGRPKYKS